MRIFIWLTCMATLFVVGHVQSQDTCLSNNCSHMTGGTPCTIEYTCDENLLQNVRKRSRTASFPDPPTNLRVFPIGHDPNPPTQNITWTHSGENLTGFLVFSAKTSDPSSVTCARFTIASRVQHVVTFHHACTEPTSYFHKIYSMPVNDMGRDYSHRLVSVYPQVHTAETTYNWRPLVAEIYNDSCAASVFISISKFPVRYGFSHIRVYLFDSSSQQQLSFKDINDTDFDTLNMSIPLEFLAVPSGSYKFKISANPHEQSQYSGSCKCKMDGYCRQCDQFNTSEFIINSLNHTKCTPPFDKVQDTVIIIACVCMIAVLGIVSVFPIVTVYRHTRQSPPEKPTYENSWKEPTPTVFQMKIGLNKKCNTEDKVYKPETISPSNASACLEKQSYAFALATGQNHLSISRVLSGRKAEADSELNSDALIYALPGYNSDASSCASSGKDSDALSRTLSQQSLLFGPACNAEQQRVVANNAVDFMTKEYTYDYPTHQNCYYKDTCANEHETNTSHGDHSTLVMFYMQKLKEQLIHAVCKADAINSDRLSIPSTMSGDSYVPLYYEPEIPGGRIATQDPDSISI